MRKSVRQTGGRGFTLVEVMLAAMLIGIAIAALVASSGAFTLNNAAGLDISTAEFLIEEIRERTATFSFDSLSNQQYSPPIDVEGYLMSEFSAFTQTITVQYVNPADLTQTVAGPTELRRVTVSITKNNRPVSSASWIRADLP